MTCRDLTEFLADYVDGDLPAPQRAVFEEHLAECPACVAYLRGYVEAVRLARAACARPDDPEPADVPEELVQAILVARRRVNHEAHEARE